MKTGNEKQTKATAAKRVFESRLAGMWYTADAKQLAQEIDGYIAAADADQLEKVIALIVPHAGYTYSGATAGFGMAQIAGKAYTRVVVLGATHRYALPNTISMPNATHYATPLGEVPLDTTFMAEIAKHPFATINPTPHMEEHSVQIEIPLLQRALKTFKLVPVICGQLDLATARQVGGILRALIDDQTLVVVSSDFTHYGDRFGYTPFHDHIPEQIEKLDMGAFDLMKQKQANRFMAYVEETGATICGQVPITILLSMLADASQLHLLKYDSSGRATGDYANTVSYLAAAVTGTWEHAAGENRKPAEDDNHVQPSFTGSEKQSLLRLARRTLSTYLTEGKRPEPDDVSIGITAGMKQVMGAFVTLHKNGRLRGCIGEIMPRRPLYQAVMDHAIHAAVDDPRFPPVTINELKDLDFEISALTPPEPVKNSTDIVIGKHGIVLQKHARAAVFLPQVAPEQGWGLEETLSNLAMKAGLPADGWQEGAQFEVFEAIVFSEA